MPNFGAVKCDLFNAHKARFSIEMLGGMKIIDVGLLNCDSIVQVRVKYILRPLRSRCMLENYT